MFRLPVLLLPAVALVCAADVAGAADIELPPGPHRDLVYGQCRTCHDLQYLVDSAGITRDDWDAVLNDMRQYGLRIPPEQRADILDYLGTYLGPEPPPASEVAEAAPADGAAVYAEQCTACHQADGSGVPGQFPPLAGNPDLFLDPLFPVQVVLNGIEGPVEVAGTTYDSVMPPFDHLSDAAIAAVINHVRSSWGNEGQGVEPLTPEDVAASREKPLTSGQVHARRAALQ